MVAVFGDSQEAIRWTAPLEPGPGQRLARRINRMAWNLLAHVIATENHWVPGHSGIPGNEEADCPANFAWDASGSTVIQRQYTTASNRARRIFEGRSATKVKWEADNCNKNFSYRLTGKNGTQRPVPMTSVKTSLATRFYRLKCGHVRTGVFLKRFDHREDDKCSWFGGGGSMAAQTRDHLFPHCSWWREQQKVPWKAVGKATGWKAGRCRHMQISEVFSIEECNQAKMDFLAATEVGKFTPKWMAAWSGRRGWLRGGGEAAVDKYMFSFLFLSIHFCSAPSLNIQMSAGMKGSGGGAPPSSRLARRRRGLSRSCHTLFRVNTVWLNNNHNETLT